MTDTTINPDQLGELTEIPADLLALVFSPGGPLKKLGFNRLLAKLIAVDVVKNTKALLDADLAWPADKVALVHSDPTALLNGWYRKTGASGAGAWTQFEILSKGVKEGADAAAGLSQAWAAGTLPGGAGTKSAREWALEASASALAAGAAAATGAGAVAAGLGPLAAITTGNFGTALATGGNIASSGTEWEFSGDIVANDGTVSSLSMEWSAAVTAEIIVIDAVSRACRYVVGGIACGAGVTTLVNPFGAFVVPANSLIGVRRTAGAGLLKFANLMRGGWKLASAAYAVGDVLPALTSWGAVQPTISFTVSMVSDSLDGRLDRAEAVMPDVTGLGEQQVDTRTYTCGLLGIATEGDIGAAFLGGIRLWGDCIVNAAVMTFRSAGSGFVELWRKVGTGWKLAFRKWAAVAIGDNTVVLPDWPANSGSYLCWRVSTGVNVSFGAGVNFRYIAAPGADAIGAVTNAFTTFVGKSLNFQAVTTIPARRSHRANRTANNGPTTVEYQKFAGATVPFGWAVAAPFAVANGLGAAGAGGWDKFAGWQPEGLGYSAVRKRKLFGRVTIADTASQVGIATQPISTDATKSAGSAVIIDGAAGKLRLYLWNGTVTAGTLVAETAFTAALVAGRAYLLALTLNEYTITAVLTDCVTGTQTTINGAAFNGAGSTRMQGRPGVLHLAGTVNWEWLRFTHDYPRFTRTVAISDSNGEGVVLAGGYSWISQLNTTFGGIVNASMSSETSSNMLSRITDLVDFRPQFFLMAMGTNDTTLAIWRLAVKTAIDAAEMIGAEPILVIPPPQPGKAALMTSMSADITGGYFGRYRSIDLLGALSAANDRTTVNGAYIQLDNIHMNAAGQARARDQALIDVPELAA